MTPANSEQPNAKHCLDCGKDNKPIEPFSGLCVDCLAKASAAARVIERSRQKFPFDPKAAAANDREDAE